MSLRSLALAALALALLAVPAQAKQPPAFYTPPKDLASYPVGTEIKSQPDVKLAPSLKVAGDATRFMYRSESNTGDARAETGLVFTPKGNPPRAGWPVVAWDHGTTGIGPNCAPSQTPDAASAAPFIASFIARGYAVVAPDYEGLGIPGEIHPYLELASEGRSTVDAVVAAHDTEPLSSRWVVVGHSQGGHAALGAAQLAEARYPSGTLLGSVPMAPGSNLTTILDFISALQPPPTGLAAEIVYAAIAAHETDPHFSLSALPPDVARAIPLAKRLCVGELGKYFATHPPSSLIPADWRQNEPLRLFADRNDPGRRLSPGPMLLVQGDADTTVPKLLSDALNQQLCGIGQAVDYRVYPGADHTGVVAAAGPDILTWVDERFAGQPAASTCP